MYRRKSLGAVLKYVLLGVGAFVSVFPFLWMVIGTTNTSADIMRSKLTFGTYLVENFRSLMEEQVGFVAGVRNSLVVSAVTTALALLICSMAGYGFEIYRSKGRDRLFRGLLLTMMIPFSALMVPLYRLFSQFGSVPGLKLFGLNTLGAMILPSVSTAFLIFFFRQNTKAFSREIVEAARIDGVSELGIFFRMYLPVMKSSFAAGTIITFMNSWNNYLWPLLVVQSPEQRTVPMVLSALGASYTTDYGALMVGIVLATLPTAIIYFLMQKEFVAGMVGSVK